MDLLAGDADSVDWTVNGIQLVVCDLAGFSV